MKTSIDGCLKAPVKDSVINPLKCDFTLANRQELVLSFEQALLRFYYSNTQMIKYH